MEKKACLPFVPCLYLLCPVSRTVCMIFGYSALFICLFMHAAATANSAATRGVGNDSLSPQQHKEGSCMLKH